jgi:hypothetical protein
MRVAARARRHEDRGGDPLDGLVNLFDLGIVLSVAFLLAALASLDLTNVLTDDDAAQAAAAAAQVTVQDGQSANELELSPGEEVIGRGQPIGTVYKLDDGRTVIVRTDENGAPIPGEGDPVTGDTTTPSTTTTTTPDTTTTPSTTPELPDLGALPESATTPSTTTTTP